MSEPTRPSHISEEEWQAFKNHVVSNGSYLNEMNYDHWWSEYIKIKEISGEA